AGMPLSPLDRAVLAAANVVLYDRALASLVAQLLPLGAYAEPLPGVEPATGPAIMPRALDFAAEGWSVVQLVAAGPAWRARMAALDTISKAEAIKQQSRQLRGNLARDLADTAHPFDKTGYSLLKFHGIYQGYDRDSATERKQRGDDKVWQFMVRVRIPGGRLTADQYLALDDLADRYANGSLRITTRQSIQFHGVLKPGLKATIAAINEALLTTLAACGDV